MWISSGKGDRVVDTYQTLNDLFRDIMDLEQKAIITDEFKDISNNDMHIIDAIGEDGCKSMSTVAKALSVTVGTLTIAINSLVKKGYVSRERSEEDRRVVLLSLSEKGKRAFLHHKKFHDAMIRKVLEGLNEQETEVLVKALQNLRGFFYGL